MRIIHFCMVAVFILLSGCSAQNELDELLILSGIGIDEGEDGRVKVILKATNPQANTSGQETGGSNQAPSYTFVGEGEDVIGAFSNVNELLGRKPFFAHIAALVVGEEYARNHGIKELIDYMERQYQIRDSYLLFISKGEKAENIMNLFTPIENSSVFTMEQMVAIPEGAKGMKDGIKLEDFIKWTYGDNRDPVALGVEKVDKEVQSTNAEILNNIEGNKNAVRLTGLAAFQNNRLQDWLTPKDTLGYALIASHSGKTLPYSISCNEGEGTIGFRLKEMKKDFKPKLEDGNLTYVINLKAQVVLEGFTCPLKLSTNQGVEELQQLVNNNLEKDLTSSLEKAQELQLDYFGIRNQLFRNETKQWEKVKNEWDELYENMEIQAHVKTYLESPGARVDNNEKTQ
ncbi:germination protein, Ger(x)C family [Halobacillus alkaliphilus]|uniref:Germination protein, Ger(X)C family n=1 Tax=Halobacillus alkaliphilus TaxID=396056 RepID=A0A1I2TGC1_9BACI|nr:Ger(x)C family spore germination protein [Halobacillus alkaliphilus]SFG63099.1 germination protein, Ger(x)C family [Halobacillus alkaliphilus]